MFKLNKVFDNMERVEYKRRYIVEHPAELLRLDKDEVERIENLPSGNKEHELLQILKEDALSGKNSGFLIFGFINNGFTVNDKLKEIALCSCPSICAQCPLDWFSKRAIKAVIKKDVRNIIYIPKQFIIEDEKGSKSLTRFLQQEIRRQVKENPDIYSSLPRDLVEGKFTAYTAVNAITQIGHEDRAMNVPNKEIWETNGGKIMFFIARHNPEIALKMLNDSLKESLAIELLKKDYKMYERFPTEMKTRKKVRLNFFYQCVYNNDNDLISKNFTTEEFLKNIKLMEINEKRKITIARKKADKNSQTFLETLTN